MTKLVATPGAGHFILSEADGYRSRKRVLVGAGQTLLAGAVLAVIGAGAATATVGTPVGIGNGAAGAWTVDAGAPAGVWTLRLLDTGATAAFGVYRPDGSLDGLGAVATAYNGGINGTLGDGSTDWVVGSEIPITVSYADGEVYVAHDPDAVSGAQHPVGLLFDDVATGAGETAPAVAIVREADINQDALVWTDHTAPQKATVIKRLEVLGIIARS